MTTEIEVVLWAMILAGLVVLLVLAPPPTDKEERKPRTLNVHVHGRQVVHLSGAWALLGWVVMAVLAMPVLLVLASLLWLRDALRAWVRS